MLLSLRSLKSTVVLYYVSVALRIISTSFIRIKRQGEFYERFAWQEGYASFSVDYRKKEAVIRYVDNQKEHHGLTANGLTFEEEYLKLLRAFGIADVDLERLFPELPAA